MCIRRPTARLSPFIIFRHLRLPLRCVAFLRDSNDTRRDPLFSSAPFILLRSRLLLSLKSDERGKRVFFRRLGYTELTTTIRFEKYSC